MSDTVMTAREARAESERCLYCFDAPCVQACPVHIDVPTFIAMIRSGNVRGAAQVVRSSNALANVCGKICPEEVFCQSVCNRTKQDGPVLIRELHFYATQEEARRGFSPVSPFQTLNTAVAVVGAGPAGLACAFELRKLGHRVTIFEREAPGGVPGTSIPPFRLAQNELLSDLDFLTPFFSVERESVDDSRLADLRHRFDAVFIAVGLGADRLPGIPGDRLKGVHPVLEFLRMARLSPGKLSPGRRTVVVGGGNVSLDAAATAKRLGSPDVRLLYRRSELEMRVWKSELQEARSQGVAIQFLVNPVRILGTGTVTGLECVRMELSDKLDHSGRPLPVPVEGSAHVIPADSVIIAIGQQLEPGAFTAIRRTQGGYLAVDADFQTSERGVFAGGDAVGGEGTIVQSVAQGRFAAHSIHRSISHPAR